MVVLQKRRGIRQQVQYISDRNGNFEPEEEGKKSGPGRFPILFLICLGKFTYCCYLFQVAM